MLEEGRIQVVDREGNRLSGSSAWQVPASQDVELVQTEEPGRAWVIAHAPPQATSVAARVYLVEAHQGAVTGKVVLEADGLIRLREQPFDEYFEMPPEVELPPDWGAYSHCWVVARQAGRVTLRVLDSRGNALPPVPLVNQGDLDARALKGWRIVSVGEGPKVWLKAGERLFFVDAEAKSPLSGPLLKANRIVRVVPGPGGRRAWVISEESTPGDAQARRRLYSVSAAEEDMPTLLLKGEAVLQVEPLPDRSRAWVTGELPQRGGKGGLHLLDLEGAPQGVGGPLFPGRNVRVGVLPSGHVWVLTRTRDASLLDDKGRVLASRSKLMALPLVEEERALGLILPLGRESEDALFWDIGATLLKVDGTSIDAVPLLEGKDVTWAQPVPESGGVWLQRANDGKLYFTVPREEDSHFVVGAYGSIYVLPAGDGIHGWIHGSTSFAYVPRSAVGARLALRGGTLEVEPGGRVTTHGTLDLRAPLQGGEKGGVDLRWPGRERAAEVDGVLEVTVLDPSHPERPVAVATRRFSEGTAPAQLNWYLPDVPLGRRTYDIAFRYRDSVGTDASLVVRGVLFRAPLSEQLWFRTAVACLVATLLFVAPMVFLPRETLARRWLPFFGWLVNVVGGTGLALARAVGGLRIHVPAFVGVLCVEMLLALVLGALSPGVFRVLAATRPFQWLVPVALGVPAMRRRIFADYVTHVRRKLEAWRRQANDEQYVPLPVDFCEGGTAPRPGPQPERPAEPPEERLCEAVTHPDWRSRANVLIESAGGRGKSALLRAVSQRMLTRFEEDPRRPLPVLCDSQSDTLEKAALRALEAEPLPSEIHEALLLRGDYVLVVDGLSESSLTPEALRAFIDSRYGGMTPLLLTTRPHIGFRQAIEGSARSLLAEPRRLDERMLQRFIAAYAPGGTSSLSDSVKQACRGPDGTYLPILVRLSLLFEGGGGGSIAELYDAAFRGLLRKRQEVAGEEDAELLAWTSAFCLRTYWANGIRSLRYRNAPEQAQMEKLLKAGVLVPDNPNVRAGQLPSQVRFFHDSMQSYLTAVGLFMQVDAEPSWDVLFRAAADPLFTNAQSELVPSAGSELFQMCLQVFGPEERLHTELRRQLEAWAHLHDEDLTKRDIANAVPEALQSRLRSQLDTRPGLSPGDTLRLAIELCAADLRNLGVLYMRTASRVWPLRQTEQKGAPG